ncbi:hypothetical protein ASF53_21075 [Methylobacterium sp. Leaf123]|uniref:SGNH/GDSL hydrolase family protein n=1 Tax=Methylobacterium sp. Leaf123 TaxID=1736264 RepID=UPI0006F744ED|nr:SGNH/GDSL hydrolase family protein [Methylobacterium sp. Leaf123]KQQ26428.1 hypothetical protein ASF53_21075 [Methylobacterium sp. Leaf123]
MSRLGFKALAYLGDSTTDSGELYRLTSIAIGIGLPVSPPYAKQFSNGPVYADQVPDLLGVEGGRDLNFAVGGAQVIPNETVVERFLGSKTNEILTDLSWGKRREALETTMDLEGQVGRLLDATESMDRSEIGVSIFAGLNDILALYNRVGLDEAMQQMDSFVATLTQAMFEDVKMLFDNGIGTVILNLLPPGGIFPHIQGEGADVASFGDILSEKINTSFRSFADALPDDHDLRIVDMGLIFDEVRDDLSTYAFQTATEPLYDGIGSALIPMRHAGSWDIPRIR